MLYGHYFRWLCSSLGVWLLVQVCGYYSKCTDMSLMSGSSQVLYLYPLTSLDKFVKVPMDLLLDSKRAYLCYSYNCGEHCKLCTQMPPHKMFKNGCFHETAVLNECRCIYTCFTGYFTKCPQKWMVL